MHEAMGSGPQHCINQMWLPITVTLAAGTEGPEVQVHLQLRANKSYMRLKNKQKQAGKLLNDFYCLAALLRQK